MKGAKPTLRRRLHAKAFRLPFMITCVEFENFVLAYLDEELPPRQRFVFELHIKMCRECRDYLKAYQAAITLAKDALQQEDAMLPEQVPDDLVKAILAAREL